MQLTNGSILQNGKYRIIRVLGQGGFGITYLAENTFFETKVAIKEFFPKDFCGRDNTSHLTIGTQNNVETVERLKGRFLKEAKNIAKLDHPGIVKIHDIFEENNTAYYVMDYIEGENLNEMVKREGPLPESKAVEYIIKVGEALEYIHSRKMTHFDVKPANIVVRSSDDRPILIDFGLSKQYDINGDATSTLMQGISHGYSPIELYNASSIATFSPQTDVYSLGATFYYLLTGSVPPSASQIIEKGLQFDSTIAPNISSAIECAMNSNRAKRYKSITDFCQVLSNGNLYDESDNVTQATLNQDSGSFSNDETKIIGDTLKGVVDEPEEVSTSESINVEEQEYDYIEPSRWDRFVTNISSTNRLIDTYSISNSRKLCYLFISIILFILSIPLGWIFWIILFNRLQGALKRLFFPNNISEFDYGADYTKAKCWGIISIPIIVIILEISIVLITSYKKHPAELEQYVNEFNTSSPYSMMGGQIDSVELDNNNLVFFCDILSNKKDKRLYINNLNVALWKPILCIEDSAINGKGYIKNYIFRFHKNGTNDTDVIVPVSELKEYKEMGVAQKANKFLDSYISLEKEFIPYYKSKGIILKDISISKSGEGFESRNNLKYVFEDPYDYFSTSGLSQDSINNYIKSQLPLGYPFLLNSIVECTDGISYQIDTNTRAGKETILLTSEEIKNNGY